MQPKNIHIGTSGWSYKDWVDVFYPTSLRSTEWLSYYAILFNITEINSSFYHLPRRSTVEGWVEKVPANFLFCPKMSRYLTHIKRLKEPEEPLERFFEVFEPMKKQMGPVLIQLPPSVAFDYDTVEYLYELLKKKYHDYSFAIEVRHPSWMEEVSLTLMAKYNISWVISQSGVGFPYAETITADNIYVRFHGPGKLYASLYDQQTLEKFAQLFKSWREEHTIWVFFNNDYYGYGIDNAYTLREMVAEK